MSLDKILKNLTTGVGILRVKFDTNTITWEEFDTKSQQLEANAESGIIAWHKEELNKELTVLLDAEMIKPEYHNVIVGKIKETR